MAQEGNVVCEGREGQRLREKEEEREGTFLSPQAIIIPASANSGVLTSQHG